MRRLLVLLLLIPVLVSGETAHEFDASRKKAIEHGIAWLEKAQAEDGSWHFDKDKPLGVGIQMKLGCTALSAYALLKAGVKPDDPVIEKAFDFICAAKGPDWVYAAGCVLLAIEARHHWEPPRYSEEEGVTTRSRDSAKAPPRKRNDLTPRELELAKQCADFLIKEQTPNGSWTYPLKTPKGDEKADASHPQYALLGLDAAQRLGIEVPRDIYAHALAYFVEHQEKDGPEVAPFPVPGADLSYKELAKIEKEMREKIQRIEGEFKGKKAGATNSSGHTEDDERRTVERDARDKAFKTTARRPMFARGWQYAYPPANTDSWKKVVTGSMTASALTSLFVCKAHLDAGADYEKLRAPVDKALRDGCAWIALHYTVKKNPAAEDKRVLNHYYYMYGLERAGILGLVPLFGEHDWYVDGTRMFVAAQKPDGSWDAGDVGTAGPVPDTCFALLFLCRGTTPLVQVPTRTATGTGK